MSALATSVEARTSVRRSLVIYLALMVYLVLVKIFLELGSVEGVVPGQATLFSWPAIGFVALAGGFCVWLGPRTALPGLWEPNISTRKRLLLPAVVGLGVGAVNLTLQALTGGARAMAEAANVQTINVPFPSSILFYSGGAIVVEVLYRLILLTLPLWLIAIVILRGRGRTPVFWVVVLLASLVEAVGQASLVPGHPGLMLVLGIAMYGLNLFEAYLFWRFGFLAPLVFRVAFYFVWHVVGGLMGL